MPNTAPTRVTPAVLLRDLRDVLVSYQMTLALLVFSMLLVFVATLDQVNLGIWAVQEKYFRSFIVYLQFGNLMLPVFPGGYTVGGLLLANLIAAHVYRFSLSWRKAGIQLTHFGLIVLLVGELLTGLWQQDYNIRLNEGETRNYSESFRENELVVIDTTDAKFDEVVSIPERLLSAKAPIQHPKLPFRIVPKTYYANSSLHSRTTGAVPPAGERSAEASMGVGDHITVAPQPLTYKQNESNMPSAIVELVGTDGSLGTWLVSTQLVRPQDFSHGGRSWQIALRTRRAYHPFSLTLLKFSHDRYPGTEIPKNFSSRLRVNTPDGRDDREVLIYMNNPLRYAGLTFYQAGFANNDTTSILQVVRNPSWLLPYIACTLMTLGMTLQFGLHLVGFVRQRATAGGGRPAPQPLSAAPSAPSFASPAPTLPRSG